VYLCELLLVLNHAILNKARAEEGGRGAHPLGGLSSNLIISLSALEIDIYLASRDRVGHLKPSP
jgi:hypothetical protein